MKTCIASVWVSMIVLIGVSLACYLTAGAMGADLAWEIADPQLPLISKAFYPDAICVYLFPVPFLMWATAATIQKKTEHMLLLIVGSLGTSILFLAFFILAMVLPHMAIIHTRSSSNEIPNNQKLNETSSPLKFVLDFEIQQDKFSQSELADHSRRGPPTLKRSAQKPSTCHQTNTNNEERFRSSPWTLSTNRET